MPEKIFYFDQIGKVTFKKNKRSKNVSIALRPMKGVIVTLPYYISYKFAINVVERKKGWILQHLHKMEEIEQKVTTFTESTEFTTKYRKLIIEKNSTDKVKTKINSHTVTISYPANYDIKDAAVQEIIKSTITKTLRLEAKEYLPLRTKELSQQYNFHFNKVFIKNAKTLWGSCSAKNNINLNLHLMRLPDYLIDYVIIHELCHTVEKNHGKRFWALMDSLLGDAKTISKKLRTYSIQIY